MVEAIDIYPFLLIGSEVPFNFFFKKGFIDENFKSERT